MFQTDDIVEYNGCVGTVVVDCMDGATHPFQLQVNFPTTKGLRTKVFTMDGRDEPWCDYPSLKLITRPKKKVKKTFYTGIYRADTRTGYSADGLLVENPEEAKEKFANYAAIAKIEIEVEVG